MRKKGYQDTQIDFLKATINCVEDNNLDGSSLGECLLFPGWTSMKNIIHSCDDIMVVFMETFGIKKDADLSPFCENFKTVSDMLVAYIDYCPRTFEYDID